jgi:hypothetical protein
MPQIKVSQNLDEGDHAMLPDNRPKAGDLMRNIWQGADAASVTFERDKTPHPPLQLT